MLFISLAQASSLDSRTTAPSSVLILYDTPNPLWESSLSRIFLANLLGHFKQTYTALPVNQFSEPIAATYDTIFYLGTHYNQLLPTEFLKFTVTTDQTIVWFNYNLWQINQITPNLPTRYGFNFIGLDQSGFNYVRYKEQQLTKNKIDKEISVTTIADPNKAVILATAEKNNPSQSIPYIIHSDNFWYIADIPFAYIDEDNRYLAFADILHDILKVNDTPKKRALIRLEDISPNYDPALLRAFADYLYQEHIPFAISLIPYYKDPLNLYPGIAHDLPMTAAPLFIETLHGMLAQGGTLILHGYTHQYEALANPYSATTGADFEFMRVKIDPITYKISETNSVPEDSPAWVEQRVSLAEALLNEAGFHTSYWETPHYVASTLDNEFFAQHFKANIGRIEYYDNSSHHANQFFPYIIYKDIYGQKVIPENLGCYSPQAWYNHPERKVSDLIRSAKNNLVVRDAWASFYYHPYLGLEPFKKLIQDIRSLGYEFVSLEEL